MKFLKYSLIFGTLLLLQSCNNSDKNEPKIDAINLEVSYPEEDVSLSEEFTDIEIIPLENKPEAILTKVCKMIVTDECIYIWDDGPKVQILSFTLDGRYRTNIGKMGHARGEYYDVSNIASNSQGDTIAVIKYPNAVLFDNKGRYLSTFEIKDDKGTDDMLLTTNGIYLGYFFRQEKSILSLYDKSNKKIANIIKTTIDPIREPLIAENGHSIQEDQDKIYCLDIFSSSIYVIDKENSNNITRYTFKMNDILTENVARNIPDIPNGIHGIFHISTYQVFNGIIRGEILRASKYLECLDFKYSLFDKKVKLMHHKDMDYSFSCNHNGFFYKIVSAEQILDYMDKEKSYMEPCREFLGDALSELYGKVSLTDNYYVIKMRLKEE